MKTYRTNAVMAGALYILGTVAGILSVVTVGGFPDEDFLARMAVDPSRLPAPEQVVGHPTRAGHHLEVEAIRQLVR